MIQRAYLMPHAPIFLPGIGGADRKRCEATLKALETVGEEVAELAPDVIILITPHGALFSDGLAVLSGEQVAGNFKQFGHPEIRMEAHLKADWISELLKVSDAHDFPVVAYDDYASKRYRYPYELDHGAMVPLSFIQDKMEAMPSLVHITYGLLSYSELYRFGRLLRQLYHPKAEKCIVIASGDLSHALSDEGPYSYHPMGCVFDAAIQKAIEDNAVKEILDLDTEMIEGAKECGYRSMMLMLGIMAGVKLNSRLLSYEGPFGVGYGVAAFDSLQPSTEDDFYEFLKHKEYAAFSEHLKLEDPLVQLARRAIEAIVKRNHKLTLEEVTEDIDPKARAGVFVSIKNAGGLRGCIGTLEPVQRTLAEEIIENAISAARYDVRFQPIMENELIGLRISVDVLGESEYVTDRSELDPRHYGVIVRKGKRSGVLLPDLEGVDTVEEQLRIACQKAGIPKDSQFDIERFKVVRHSPWQHE